MKKLRKNKLKDRESIWTHVILEAYCLFDDKLHKKRPHYCPQTPQLLCIEQPCPFRGYADVTSEYKYKNGDLIFKKKILEAHNN